MKKERVFKILKVGNFYFPVRDKDKMFEVVDTWDIKIPAKEIDDIIKMYKKLDKKEIRIVHFMSIADIIWKHAKKQIKEKADWLCPQLLHKFGNGYYICSIDILKEAKK